MAKNKNSKNDALALDVQLTKSEAFIEKHLKTILIVLLPVSLSGIIIKRIKMPRLQNTLLKVKLLSVKTNTNKPLTEAMQKTKV